jgi:hypothetical protein
MPCKVQCQQKQHPVTRFGLSILWALLPLLGAWHGFAQAPIPSIAPGTWRPGEAIPLAPGVTAGPLGQTRTFHPQPMGTADVYGHGPYDLFVNGRLLLPFKSFDSRGVPVYGTPVKFRSPNVSGSILTSPGGAIRGLFKTGNTLRLLEFDKQNLVFNKPAEATLPNIGAISEATGYETPAGRFVAFFTLPDGQPYNPPGVGTHDAAFQPFNGSGLWRGGMPYDYLNLATFSGISLTGASVISPLFPSRRDFTFNCPSMAIVNLGAGREHDLIACNREGGFLYYHNSSTTGGVQLQPALLVSDPNGIGLRHPGLGSAPAPIPNPKTGLSDLLVGDTGFIWHYKFSGKFTPQGAPVYEAPQKVYGTQPVLTLGALPVLTPGDVDGDGKVDLIVGNDVGALLFVKNIGAPGAPAFDIPVPVQAGGKEFHIEGGYAGSIQGPAESRWGYVAPTLFDWNGDGHLDVVLNSILADYVVLLQLPGSNPPAFTEPLPIYCDSINLHLPWRSRPAVTDWASKGQACLIANDENNQLRCYWRIDAQNVRRGELLKLTTGAPIQSHGSRFAGQWGRTNWQAVDWDGDGKIDLLGGTGRSNAVPGPGGIPDDVFGGEERQAAVLFLRNVGTNAAPVFAYPQVMASDGKKISLGIHGCAPAAVDFGNGRLDLLVSMEDAVVMYYPRPGISLLTVPPNPAKARANAALIKMGMLAGQPPQPTATPSPK